MSKGHKESLREYVEPIKKKWVYHFIVSPKTSVIDKPEWYLNQTLKWIYEHIDKVEKEVQKGSKNDQTIRRSFVLSMLELTKMRLTKDMTRLARTVGKDHNSDALLIHTYNETIQFIKVIRQILGDSYSKLDDRYDLMLEFSNQKLFEKIDDVEYEYSTKNLREIISSDCKWDPVLEGDYIDYYKIPRCVDRFLLLIRSISERVDCFTEKDCKYRLIDLQCSLFDRFLIFLKQSAESSQKSKNIITDIFFFTDESTIDLSRILRVLNSVNFLRLLLRERCFIAPNLVGDHGKDLSLKLDRTTQDFNTMFNRLIDKVVNIYECTDCSLRKFLDFIKPKLSNDIYELVRDEVSKIHQARQTQSMLKGKLALGRE